MLRAHFKMSSRDNPFRLDALTEYQRQLLCENSIEDKSETEQNQKEVITAQSGHSVGEGDISAAFR